ncbi:helix-hairpin-helix domain-containing protein [Halobacillus yeomjeoni]|uniref:Helix-hairpin-helix domain-containing protein n=1 Tax=Halobacillus yeomjeoni TaxID=311194 RepID=A0A931HV53_9BACI|nr:helix-hairpin-helix domain-containing protein [Halobacillus yeomjeoni]MBH0229938.1 helix-hairpin-helix domain-containing protein [Halobacillus yeomjeoni]
MKFIRRYGWIFLLIIVGIGLYVVKAQDQGAAVQITSYPQQEESVKEETKIDMKVDVKGEVVKPGVYTVNKAMRVHDVVEMAGGMTPNADMTSVNLAQKVQDEMVIIILSKLPEKGTEVHQADKKLSLNQATLEELQSLDGIGLSKANAIIQYREEHGPFIQVDDLLKVTGIGAKTLERFKEKVRVP